MNCPTRLAILCAVGLVVVVASRNSGVAEAKPLIMGHQRFIRQMRSGVGVKREPLDAALGSMSTKDLYKMLALLDMVEEQRKMAAPAHSAAPPKEDLSRMLELLQMVDEAPRYDM